MCENASKLTWTIDHANAAGSTEARKTCDYWLGRAQRLRRAKVRTFSGQFRRDTALAQQH